MPFKINDVAKYNQNIKTDKQKRKWVAIANSVLEHCKQRNRQDCDALAIKTANGASKKGAKQLKPSGFRKAASDKKCSTCEYFNLEWCELYNYLVSPNDTCNLYIPIFSYGIKK